MKNSQCRSFEKAAEEIFKHSEATLQDVKKHLKETSYEGAMARGKLFELVGHFESAIESYKDAVRLNEKNSLAKCRLALSQIKAGHLEAALNTASEVAKAEPFFEVPALSSNDNIPALTILGDALCVNQRFEEALKTYLTVSEKGKADSYTQGRLAQLYILTGQEEKAIKLADKISASVRFSSLGNILSTTNVNITKLSGISRATLVESIMIDVHGRPLVSGDEIKVARMENHDTGWCSSE